MISTLKVIDWTPEDYVANRTICNTILEDTNTLKEIPSLNNAPLDKFKDKQLVRFRGMIQDMHNPEYYFQQYEVKNIQTGASEIRCGMYTDSARCLPYEEIVLESEKNLNSERHTCIVISTPGLNDWVKEDYKHVFNTATNVSDKVITCSQKRNLNETESMDCTEPAQKKEKIFPNDDTKMDTTECNTKQNILSKEHILNFPISIDDGKACIVKIYEETAMKLNDIIEIVGFISLDPFLCSVQDTEDPMTEAERNTHHPPASLVPRLHAIKVIRVAKHEFSNGPEIVSRARSIRSDLHLIFSQLLFGDHLAADYLICHLLSAIYMRRDYFCLGTYPINITNFPSGKYKGFPKDFYKLLMLLVKKSHFLEITLENLNDLSLLPKKDYECNRLTSGVLQLSNNTHLVIDETGLTTGQLTQAGRENYNAICDLINFQKVTYDFKFYKMEYETDIPVLIFSETKSFIPCQTQIRLKIDSDSENLYPQVLEIANQYLKGENRLTYIRQYLEVLKHTEFEFNEDIVKVIQDDFIQMRQTNKSIGPDYLHSLMILARLISLSYGSNVLTAEYWKRAIDMETERMSRLPQQK